MALRAAALAAAAGLAHAQTNVGKLTMLTDTKARCMDGTLSGYYFVKASAPANATKWIISLDGGGECATQSACQGALRTSLGSSKYFSPSIEFDNEGMQFNDANTGRNPDFGSWNHVQVPYCSQDLHTGQTLAPSNNTWGLYFSGHFVLQAILDALEASGGLAQATDILLTGDSAGGIGVWPNLDWLADRYPKARVVGAPIAGSYFYATWYTGPNASVPGLADFRPAAWPQHYALWSSFVDEDCKAANPANPGFCILSNNSFPYVKSETFAIEAQTDEVVLTAHDGIPAAYITQPPEYAFLQEWHANMTVTLSPLSNPADARHGTFSPACFIHTSFSLEKPLIKGKNYLTTAADWYFRRTAPSEYKLADDCGILCGVCP